MEQWNLPIIHYHPHNHKTHSETITVMGHGDDPGRLGACQQGSEPSSCQLQLTLGHASIYCVSIFVGYSTISYVHMIACRLCHVISHDYVHIQYNSMYIYICIPIRSDQIVYVL